jgi:hypothetical protein
MPIYERACERCDWTTDFSFEAWRDREKLCPQCGGWTVRVWTGTPAIIPDTFREPLVDEHMTKETQVFHSRSERKAAIKRHGAVERVRHIGVPGTDKSVFTTKWF